MEVCVTNIQRMCFHDGPGIRTTVFLKGCSIRCPWCSNPENLSFEPEEYEKDGQKGIYGRWYSAEVLLRALLKDRVYWGESGGVTFSGGEALMQVEGLLPILQLLKQEDIHIAVETALFVPQEHLKKVCHLIDYFIIDIKLLEEERCREILKGELSLYLRNIDFLFAEKKLSLFRIPCCKEYTFTEANRKKIMDFLEKYQGIPVQLFQVHNLGEAKYLSLGRKAHDWEKIADVDLKKFCNELKQRNIAAEIIKI